MSSERVAELREQLDRALYEYHVLDDPDALRRRVRRPLRRARGAGGGGSVDRDARLAHAARRRASRRTRSPRSSTWRRWARSRRSRPARRSRSGREDVRKRLGTDEPVVYVTEPKIDGSAVSLVYENGLLRPRRDPRRRDPRRGRDPEPAHDQGDPAPPAARRRPAAGARRGPRRDLLPALGVPAPERAARGRGEEARAEPAQRRRPARCARRIRPSPPSRDLSDLGLRARAAPSVEFDSPLRVARVAARARLPHEPLHRAARVARGRRPRVRGVGAAPASSSTTRSTASSSRSTRSTSSGASARCTAARAGRARSSGRRSRPQTKLLKIHIRVGRTGNLNPWAQLEPVEVGGVTVSQATLHNEEDINRKDIREGDTVIVQRAGDVIPQIVGPVLPHAKGTKPFRMPKKCPLCGAEVVKPEGEVMHRCPNDACPVARARDAEPLGERRDGHRGRRRAVRPAASGTIGLLRSMPDLYRLTPEQLVEFEGYGDISAQQRGRRDRSARRQQPFSRVLFGLNIPDGRLGDGRRTSRATSARSTRCSPLRRRRSRRSRASGPTAPRSIAEWFADADKNAARRRAARAGPALRVGRGGAGPSRGRSPARRT